MTKTIVLIHGAWLSPASWDGVKARYEARGYTVHAVGWPHDDRPVAELRAKPHPDLGKLGVQQILQHYETFIQRLPEKPIIMGHSFGGLFTQLLADRALGAAAVAIDPGAPAGVFPGVRTLLSATPVFLAPFGFSRALRMSEKAFAANFAQTLSPEEAAAAWEKYVVPTPGRIYYEAGVGIGTGVDWKNPYRPPLLMIGAEKSRIISQGAVRAAFKRHSKSPVKTDYKSFPGRSHWLMVEKGWEEVADFALDWAEKNATA